MESESILIENSQDSPLERDSASHTRKRHGKEAPAGSTAEDIAENQIVTAEEKRRSWRRILLLIVAITVHNIPGKETKFVSL